MIETPHDINAEKYILGCCLVNEDKAFEVIDSLNENDFYYLLHKDIFRIFKNLLGNNEQIDAFTVSTKLKKSEEFKAKGGFKYLTELQDSVESIVLCSNTIKTIKEKSKLRQLLNIVTKTQEEIEKETETTEIIDSLGQKLYEISKTETEKKGLQSAKKTAVELIKEVEKIKSNPNNASGLKTGFAQLDDITRGFNKQALVIIAGKTSSGKTSFTMNIVENVAKRGKGVAIFSLEMSTQELNTMLVSSIAKLDNYKISMAKMTTEEEDTFRNGIFELAKMPIFIDDSANVDFFYIRNQLRKLCNKIKKEKRTLDLIVIDHLQIMKKDSRFNNTYTQITELSKQAKDLAKDFNIPVILLCQMNKDSEKREKNEPRLNDLRDSGSISENADKVIFVHRLDYFNHDDPDLKNKAKLLIRKNRGAVMCADINLRFEPCLTRFHEEDI